MPVWYGFYPVLDGEVFYFIAQEGAELIEIQCEAAVQTEFNRDVRGMACREADPSTF